MNSTQNLKYDHTYVRRLGHVAESCSSKLYNDEDILGARCARPPGPLPLDGGPP